MLKNGSFTEGWTDMPPAPGFLINQQPKHWTLRWLEDGESLFGVGDTASGVPECVHKLQDQLPAHEHLGGPNALILEGDTTYKIFHASSTFGAELSQTVTGLEPGTQAKLTVPIQVHRHGDPDPFGAESGVWVNGEGHWVNSGDSGDRKWFEHVVEFTVPDNGVAEIVIRVKSKWPRAKDFFMDGIKLEATAAAGGDVGGTEPEPQLQVIRLQVPEGVRVETAAGDEPGVLIVTVPPGFSIEVG